MTRVWGPERQAGQTQVTNATVQEAQTPTTNMAAPARALAICAHPDDAEFFVAGTFAKWAKAGTFCAYLVLTDGSKGSWGDISSEDLVLLRQKEQRAAAEAIGVQRVDFAGFEDGFLVNNLDTRKEVALWIREIRPTVIFAHDPWKPYRLHPDHREAGFLACDAVTAAREPSVYPDSGLPAHRPNKLFLFETNTPDHAEEISHTLEDKIVALLSHKTQYKSTMDIERDLKGKADPQGITAFQTRVHEWTQESGKPFNLPHAEVFKKLRT